MSKAVSPGSGAAPAAATGQSLVTRNTLDISKIVKTIPATATSVTVFVIQSPLSALGSQYFPVATCVSVPVPGSGLGPTAIPFAAPVGIDYVVVAASTGPCAQASGASPAMTLPAIVNTALQTAIANGAYALTGSITTATLPTVPVAGTIGTGTWLTLQAGIAGNPFTVSPGGAIAVGPVNLGYQVGTTQTITGASLSSTTPGITSFQMDVAGTYGLPFSFVLTGPNGTVPASGASCNPITSVGACNNLDVPVTVAVKNTSTRLFPVLSLALVNPTGGAPLANNPMLLGGPGCSAVQLCASIVLGSNLAAGQQFVVLYNGLNQEFFQSATVTVTYNGSTLASFPVTTQPQVQTLAQQGATTLLPAGNPSAAVNPLGPMGLTIASIPSVIGSVYVADGPNVNVSTSGGATPFTTNQITFMPVGTDTHAGSVFTAIVQFGVYGGGGSVYVADELCSGCSGTATGVWVRGNSVAGLSNLTTPSGQSMFQSTVLPPFPPGPIGLTFWRFGFGAPANGVLFVAAN
ncbi:MAG: hypothetical protein JO359_04785, partial [Candidatus Eremiobacteraeota bacterium]|nr:hypothetical protein [Candidatus Eremiobacteraeota bacterium]